MLRDYVLDTFALIALIRQEPSASRVRSVLDDAEHNQARCFISAMNIGEAAYTIERKANLAGVQDFLAAIRLSPLNIVEVSWDRILAAAHIKARFPVSYADAFVIALAHELEATVLTGDPEFQAVALETKIEWLDRR